MISVIVPIYKVENYLPACLDSILNSTYKDIEVILVDDGSPDGCGAICDRYAEKDSRVRVIHQPNQGVSAARNAGLDAAKGEYIAFVDSDDVIHPQMMETLLKLINSGDYDFSMVHGVMVQDKGIGYNYVDDVTPLDLSSSTIISRDEYIQHLADLSADSFQYHVI
jgi:glycosyltransferase involved in cell wall biosynthesis